MREMDTQLVQDLRDARALIEDPRSWGKGFSKRSSSEAPGGYVYCLGGALMQIAFKSGFGTSTEELAFSRMKWTLRAILGDGATIVMFNDNPDTTHAMVLAVIDEAIEGESKE